MSGTIEEAQENPDNLNQEVQNAEMGISLSKSERVLVNGERSIDNYINGETLWK